MIPDVHEIGVTARTEDGALVALMAQLGRYLLLGSSGRPASLPANLQGVWADSAHPPWGADFHMNEYLLFLWNSCPVTCFTIPHMHASYYSNNNLLILLTELLALGAQSGE